MARRLKVVRIVTRLNVGGPTRHVALLARELPARGIDTVLAAGVSDPGEGDRLLADGLSVHDVPSLARGVHPLRDLATLVALRRLLRKERPDVVHTHQGKAGWIGRLAARLEGVPVVVHTFHGFTFTGHFGGFGARLVVAAERIAAGWATDLVCQDDAQAKELVARFGARVASKVRLVRPASDVGDAVPRAPMDPPRVVFAARLVPVKDPFLALDVLRSVPGVVMDVLGDGPLRASLEARVAAVADLQGRVVFHGNVVPPFDIVSRASAVLLTSHSEGTPLVALEAQMLGVPVVAPDVGGVRGVVLPGGGRVVAREVNALAQALAEVVKAPRLDPSVVAEARRLFGRARLADDVATLYRDAAARATRAR